MRAWVAIAAGIAGLALWWGLSGRSPPPTLPVQPSPPVPEAPSAPAPLRTRLASRPAVARVEHEATFTGTTVASLDGGQPRPAMEVRWTSGARECGFERGVYTCGACRNDSECPAGHACLLNPAARRTECLPEQCHVDADCPQGAVCRVANAVVSGPPIRRCLPAGNRGERERCSPTPGNAQEACQAGLRCTYGRCGKPCESDTDCRDDELCFEERGEAACFATCEKTGCPAGEACVDLGDELFVCAVSKGRDCTANPCPDGQECLMSFNGRSVGYQCLKPCNPLRGSASCPEGYVCGASGQASYCYLRCGPERACPEGERCSTVSEDLADWGCKVAL